MFFMLKTETKEWYQSNWVCNADRHVSSSLTKGVFCVTGSLCKVINVQSL